MICLDEVNNHIKAFKLHLLQDQSELLTEGPLYNIYTGENTGVCRAVISLPNDQQEKVARL